MQVQVECAPPPSAPYEPVVFWLGSRQLDVVQVVDRWFSSTQRWVKVDASDGQLYVLRLDEGTGEWELAALTRRES